MRVIKKSDMADFIRENFGKTKGIAVCKNPHWWLRFNSDHVAYEHRCCDAEFCDSNEYQMYTDAESLIIDRGGIIIDGIDDWIWRSDDE
jgi:hypothetical protein